MSDTSGSRSITDSASDPGLRFQRAALLLLVAGISALFLKMVLGFLLAVLLAAILAGMTYPAFERTKSALGGRANWASLITILLVLLVIVVPLAAFLTLVAAQSVSLSQSIPEWMAQEPDRLAQIRQYLERIPFADRLIPEGQALVAKLGELAGSLGPLLAGQMAALGRGTLNFVLQLFVTLYAMFYFLVDGPGILRLVLYYIPLAAHEENQLLERFVSVTRATLRGSLLIGVIQGALAGVAFWVCGVPAPAFWGTATIIVSIIPAIGGALIWIPIVLYLFATSATAAAIGLLVWCVLVVSSVDNFLRPRLIGRDARMSDLMILLSTLGGISLFGALGFIIGPIIAALFVTVWHIYGKAFQAWLPLVPAEALVDVSEQSELSQPIEFTHPE